MKTNRFFTLTSLLVALVLLSSSAGLTPVAAQSSQPEPNGELLIESQKLTWQTNVAYDHADLSIRAADETLLQRSFDAGETIELSMSVVKLADGNYLYQLILSKDIDPFLAAELRLAREDPELLEKLSAQLPQPVVFSGAFSVQDGAFAPPLSEEDGAKDVLHYDDVIITGSLCVGFDCTENLSFGFDTIILKENNLRIFFDDTSSTAGFPSTDWTIIINDSASGGLNYFAIQDRTNSQIPFKIEGGADNDSIYIDDYGRVGFGTNNPVLELHVKDSDTPGLRLEQDNTGGWTAQTWDVAGNEANFFIRDVTAGSRLPFRIQPGAQTDTLTMKTGGKVGINTWSPAATLDIQSTDTSTTTVLIGLGEPDALLHVYGSIFADNNVGIGTTTPTEKLHVVGNIRADGYVIEFSDVNAKENFARVDGAAILDKIANLKILSWNYKQEADSVRHIGPMAQDFFAAFNLGADDKHIAGLDVNGITLAAIQELIRINQQQAEEIEALKAQNAALEARLERLEKAVLP